MLVQITKESKGCTFKKGSTVKVGDKQGQNLIRQGMAKLIQKTRPDPKPTVKPQMIPVMNICACGYVGIDAEDLKNHRCE